MQNLKLSEKHQTECPILPDYMSNIWSDIGINLDQTYDLKNSMLQIKDTFGYITQYDNDHMGFYTKSLIKSIHLLKTENKLKDKDFSGAITNAKSLVEQVIRDLSTKLETDFIDNDLGKSFKNVQTKMNMNPKDYEHNGFRQILTGLIGIVSGIAEVRNKTSDSHSRIYNPSEHHAILVVNSARTICSFLVDSYKYQKSMDYLKK